MANLAPLLTATELEFLQGITVAAKEFQANSASIKLSVPGSSYVQILTISKPAD